MESKEFTIVSLGELIKEIIDNRGKTPPCEQNGIELIETTSLVGNNKNPDYEKINKFVSKETYENWFRKGHPQQNDILIALVGANMGNLCLVEEERGCIAQNLVGLRFKQELCDIEYMYYFMSSSDVQNKLKNMNRGSAQPNLKISDLKKLDVNLPNIQTQRAIGGILSSIDNKIKLNSEMNKTLEEMAQALFKRWFVDFEFPNEDGRAYKSSGGEMVESELGMIPKGWVVYSIDEICDINMSNYSKKDSWSCINYLDTANITNNKIENIQKIDCLIDKAPSRAKRKVKEDSIIYSTVRPNQLHYGIIKTPVDNMIVSTGFVVLDSRIDYIKNDIIYFWLIQDNHTEVLQAIGETSTSTYPSIKPSDIGNMKLSLPPKEIVEGLSDKFNKINLYINQLRNEEKQLIEIRDTLLPKLMSGEIRVEDIETNL